MTTQPSPVARQIAEAVALRFPYVPVDELAVVLSTSGLADLEARLKAAEHDNINLLHLSLRLLKLVAEHYDNLPDFVKPEDIVEDSP